MQDTRLGCFCIYSQLFKEPLYHQWLSYPRINHRIIKVGFWNIIVSIQEVTVLGLRTGHPFLHSGWSQSEIIWLIHNIDTQYCGVSLCHLGRGHLLLPTLISPTTDKLLAILEGKNMTCIFLSQIIISYTYCAYIANQLLNSKH